MFLTFGPDPIKTFSVRNLRIFVISQSVCPRQAFPVQSNDIIDIERKFRLLKVCYMHTTSTTFQVVFLLRPLTVLIRQTRMAVCVINPSIYLRCLWFGSKARDLYHNWVNLIKLLWCKSTHIFSKPDHFVKISYICCISTKRSSLQKE